MLALHKSAVFKEVFTSSRKCVDDCGNVKQSRENFRNVFKVFFDDGTVREVFEARTCESFQESWIVCALI